MMPVGGNRSEQCGPLPIPSDVAESIVVVVKLLFQKRGSCVKDIKEQIFEGALKNQAKWRYLEADARRKRYSAQAKSQ